MGFLKSVTRTLKECEHPAVEKGYDYLMTYIDVLPYFNSVGDFNSFYRAYIFLFWVSLYYRLFLNLLE